VINRATLYFATTIFLVTICYQLAWCEERTHTVETKYTWPKGYDRDSECELAKIAAKNMARNYVRESGSKHWDIIKLNISECDCKQGLSNPNIWGCKAQATVVFRYEEKEADSLDYKMKAAFLEAAISEMTPDLEHVWAIVADLKHNIPGLWGALKGTKILEYFDAFHQIQKRIQKADEILNNLQNNPNKELVKSLENLTRKSDGRKLRWIVGIWIYKQKR